MTNQSTIDKLIEMRLTSMADAFRNQLDDPKFMGITFEDQFGMLVDIEYGNRKNNRLKRLIKNAGFDQPEASIMDINYTSGRKLNKDNTTYVRLPNMLIDLEIVRTEGNYRKVMAKYANPLHNISMREVYGLDKTLRE